MQPLSEKLGDKLLKAMSTDSVNLRQELLWTEVVDDLLNAGEIVINELENYLEDFQCQIGNNVIYSETYSKLESFKSWFKIFQMDLKIIDVFRRGSESFVSEGKVDNTDWIVRC